MTVLVGKFGPLSLAESEAMQALAKAYALATVVDAGSWQRSKLSWVFETECSRLGLEPTMETFAEKTDPVQGAIQQMLAIVRAVGAAYPNDPGTSDLYDEQPVRITLGDVRRAWAVLARVDR